MRSNVLHGRPPAAQKTRVKKLNSVMLENCHKMKLSLRETYRAKRDIINNTDQEGLREGEARAEPRQVVFPTGN